MSNSIQLNKNKPETLFRIIVWLSIFTIVYNVLEGIMATYFGYEDESLALFGFGLDSFIEAISGVGIMYMVFRIRQNPISERGSFERTALKVTGMSFYALTAILFMTSSYNIWTNHKPSTTFWGILIALISITIMWLLVIGKQNVGKKLKSEAILADAECTRVCIYMSVALLLSSLIYELTKFPYADVLGTIVIAYLCLKEGKECFEKAKSNKNCSCE